MKNILVVDDDKTNLIAARNTLGELYKVIAVPSGMQALKYLENNLCDLILLDINMPDMDGFDVMRRIREKEELSHIPIIFLTADHDPKTENRCLEEGAIDYVTKPFVPMVMLSRIGRVLEIEDMRQQLADKLEKKIREVSEIKSKSRQDALTGLWNRVYTEEMINEMIRNNIPGSFFMMDMDNFKSINDNFGHIEGDNALKMFADTLRKCASEGDVLCRIGGDEFVMFVKGIVEKERVSRLAEAIISDLAAKIEEKKYGLNCSISIGIAQTPEDGADFNTIYNAADKALYYVKQNGKNAFHFYSEQKIDENTRGNTLVDLKYLREMMLRADTGKGAYQLELDNFRHVYNFIRRFVERSGRAVQTVLFTVCCDNNTGQEEIDLALEKLEQAICTSLRKTDISTRYSSKQVIVILMETDSENGSAVARRILDYFDTIYLEKSVTFRFDIAKMEGKDMV